MFSFNGRYYFGRLRVYGHAAHRIDCGFHGLLLLHHYNLHFMRFWLLNNSSACNFTNLFSLYNNDRSSGRKQLGQVSARNNGIELEILWFLECVIFTWLIWLRQTKCEFFIHLNANKPTAKIHFLRPVDHCMLKMVYAQPAIEPIEKMGQLCLIFDWYDRITQTAEGLQKGHQLCDFSFGLITYFQALRIKDHKIGYFR
jgi:hypothetical protein